MNENNHRTLHQVLPMVKPALTKIIYINLRKAALEAALYLYMTRVKKWFKDCDLTCSVRFSDAQSMPPSSNQTQVPAQAAQPMAAAPFSVMSTTSRRFHWLHVVLAVGFLAVSGAGAAIVFKNSVITTLKSWIRRVVLDEENAIEKRTAGEPSLAEEAAAAAKTAAVAAADVAKASQEILIMKNEEKKYFMEFMSLLDVQLQEIRIMRNAIIKLEGQTYIPGRNFAREEYLGGSVGRSMHQMGSKSEYDTRSVRSASPPTSHPKSYMEIMATVQRGERPSSIRLQDMDDRPLDPNQSISNSSFATRAEPCELGWSASNSSFVPQSQATTEGSVPMAQDDPNNTSTPWWEQKNPRITEIENGNDPKTGLVSSGTVNIDNPMARRWVPPQTPSVFMPEAAAAVAIRQPKSSNNPKDVNVKAENSAQSAGEVDELQRITQIAESGGATSDECGEGELRVKLQ